MLLGCIADDFTGATDLANTLSRHGMRCIQMNGLPEVAAPPVAAEAVVVALKTRSVAAGEAIEQSVAALDWLRRNGARKFFFKYCSTFDSTDQGNIGPVAEALMAALETDLTVACPAAPENGRTVYQGHLFVGDTLLSETGMRNHPLNPMTDSNLIRVLARQSEGRVGLVPFPVVADGAAAVRDALGAQRRDGTRLCIVDALNEGNLADLAEATADLPLITGGSGLAVGLPEMYRRRGELGAIGAAEVRPIDGPEAVISGSCSQATNLQVERMAASHPHYRLDPFALADDPAAITAALDWAAANLGDRPILLYSTAPPEELAHIQAELGQERASAAVESAMGGIAKGLIERGVRRLVVAGGETAGAVVTALDVRALAIGPEIDPGVPWTFNIGEPEIALALKSGNFGGPDFFTKAFEALP